MNQFENINQIINSLSTNFEVETIPLNNSLNRILQEDVIADIDMPPFHKSAMDGYACHFEDIGNKMEVLEVLHAGMVPSKPVGKNQCSKIMTGAAVPNGCDCVFMVEDAENIDEQHVRCINPKTNKNICFQGEDYKSGTVLIEKGTIIKVSHKAVLAGAGYHSVKVSSLPKISLIATGTELVEPDKKPQPGKIRNSNASQVIAQLKELSLNVNYLGLAIDDYDELTSIFRKAVNESDFVIFTGGASVGDFDFIPSIIKNEGFDVLWERTGIKPGNPMSFSKKEKKYCIGLSGNPVSSMMQFELIAKPTIYKILGANYYPLRIKSTLSFNYQRKKADRVGIVPVVINNEGLVEEVTFNGSAHINALAFANALMEVPVEQTILRKGEQVYVRPI